MSAFDQAFICLIGHEGGYCCEREDPGNWTGGAVGSGELLGTNWGVDSASYSDVLRALPEVLRASLPAGVKDLTEDQAKTIYRARYWDVVRGDDLPPALALLVFDAAVNNGPGRAARWLQAAVSAPSDGQVGPATISAVTQAVGRTGGAALCAEFQAQRLVFMANLPTWRVFGLGWARRLCALPYESLTINTGA